MMTSYKVIVRRNGVIVAESIKWASPLRATAIDALTREAKKYYGDNCTVEIH